MKKKIRFGFLVLAGALAYFAAAKTGTAECFPNCWDNNGTICCTDAYCFDYCW